MPTLREVQDRLMSAVLEGATESPTSVPALDLLVNRGEWSRVQLRVYQNNALANVHESLKSTYPVIAKLVGEDYFRQLARGLRQRHPSRSGDLLWVGQHLPAYLAELHSEDDYQYLPDVARLEWLAQESLLAADHGPFNFSKLAKAAENHDALTFVPHPTVRLFESRFPVLRIWDSNISHEAGEQAVIDLGGGADRVLLLRHRMKLQFHRLTPGERRFLRGLLDGCRFAPLIEECTQFDASFDATVTLQRFVGLGVIVDCRW